MTYLNWLNTHSTPVLAGVLLLTALLYILGRQLRNVPLERVASSDYLLVEQAILKVSGDTGKETYLRVVVLETLWDLTRGYNLTDRVRFFLGSVYLLAGFTSIAVTGTNFEIAGQLNTVKLSFAINIVGEVAAGFLIFCQFETRSEKNHRLASLMRLEVAQFIAESALYHERSLADRWQLLTATIQKLLLKAVMNTIELPLPPPPDEDGGSGSGSGKGAGSGGSAD